MSSDYEHLEEKVRKAGDNLREQSEANELNETEAELEKISRHAQRDLVLRDTIHLGFGQLLTTFLTLFSGIYRYLNQLKKEQENDR